MVFSGINFHYFKSLDLNGKEISGYSGDVGAAIALFDFIYLGCAAQDLITFKGYNMPRKLQGSAEISLFSKILNLTAGGIYHLDHKKELFTEERNKLRFYDVSAGFDVNIGMFIISGGVANSSFSDKISFDNSIKSIGTALYHQEKGGIYITYSREKELNSFGIQLTAHAF